MNRLPADQKRHSAKDPKTAINEAPWKWNATELTCDKRERDDSGAGDQAEDDDPFVAYRIDIGTNKRNCDDDVSEGKPIRTVGEEGIKRVRVVKPFVDAFNPLKQSSRFGNCLQCARME